VAAQSLAAARGYPWPVVKLACFGTKSWHGLQACLSELAPQGSRLRKKARPEPARRSKDEVQEPERGRSLVGGGRAPAQPSGWALAAAMERYLDAHRNPVDVKTVRAVRP
jgi:hypothetical protein